MNPVDGAGLEELGFPPIAPDCLAMVMHPGCLDYVIMLRPGRGEKLAWVLRADHYGAFDLRSVEAVWSGVGINLIAIIKFRSVAQRDAYLKGVDG